MFYNKLQRKLHLKQYKFKIVDIMDSAATLKQLGSVCVFVLQNQNTAGKHIS